MSLLVSNEIVPSINDKRDTSDEVSLQTENHIHAQSPTNYVLSKGYKNKKILIASSLA